MLYIIGEVLLVLWAISFIYSFWNDLEPHFGDKDIELHRKVVLFFSAIIYFFIKYK